MSNLLKALKRAEQDRAAARQVQADATTASSVELPIAKPVAAATDATATVIATDDDATALPAVMRMQRDMVRPSERLAPHASPHALSPGPYRGVGISLALAVLFAVGVGLWARDTDKPAASRTISNRMIAPQVATQATTIPAALRVSEAGPLQLRLDRSVDAIGQAIHLRSKAQ